MPWRPPRTVLKLRRRHIEPTAPATFVGPDQTDVAGRLGHSISNNLLRSVEASTMQVCRQSPVHDDCRQPVAALRLGEGSKRVLCIDGRRARLAPPAQSRRARLHALHRRRRTDVEACRHSARGQPLGLKPQNCHANSRITQWSCRTRPRYPHSDAIVPNRWTPSIGRGGC
jgi:hypothetical protein